MSWSRLPVSLRAIMSGLVVALVAANVWPLLLVSLGAPLAAICEAIFLSLYIWWAAGGGPPRSTQDSRAFAFRRGALSSTQWSWSIVAALFFAVTIHAAIVLLFRFVPFPKEAFRHGYDLAFIPFAAIEVAGGHCLGGVSGDSFSLTQDWRTPVSNWRSRLSRKPGSSWRKTKLPKEPVAAGRGKFHLGC